MSVVTLVTRPEVHWLQGYVSDRRPTTAFAEGGLLATNCLLEYRDFFDDRVHAFIRNNILKKWKLNHALESLSHILSCRISSIVTASDPDVPGWQTLDVKVALDCPKDEFPNLRRQIANKFQLSIDEADREKIFLIFERLT